MPFNKYCTVLLEIGGIYVSKNDVVDNSPFATPGVVMSLLSGSCIRPAKIQEEMLEVVQGGRKN